MWGLWILAGLIVAVAAALALRKPLARYRAYRGRRIITCPENRKAAAVDVNARLAAFRSDPGGPHLELRNCSRWPEMAGCGQECLSQVAAAPEGCLVGSIVRRWYHGQHCVFCGTLLESTSAHHHVPAVVDDHGAVRQWSAFRAEELPHVFATQQPVCWDCWVTESLRSARPELVTQRDSRAEW